VKQGVDDDTRTKVRDARELPEPMRGKVERARRHMEAALDIGDSLDRVNAEAVALASRYIEAVEAASKATNEAAEVLREYLFTREEEHKLTQGRAMNARRIMALRGTGK
jgi:uncharacterized protein YoxC